MENAPTGHPFKNCFTIMLAGEIKWEMVDRVFEDFVGSAQGRVKDLLVMVTSQGGDRDAGIAVMNLLRGFNVRLTTVAFGKVYSAGIYPLLASADRRYALEDTVFLFHPTTYELGDDCTVNTMRENIEADIIDSEDLKKLLTQMKVHSPIRDSVASPKTSLFLPARAAQSYGIVNHVIKKFSDITFD